METTHTLNRALSVHGLSKIFTLGNGQTVTALDDVTLHIEETASFALWGRPDAANRPFSESWPGSSAQVPAKRCTGGSRKTGRARK